MFTILLTKCNAMDGVVYVTFVELMDEGVAEVKREQRATSKPAPTGFPARSGALVGFGSSTMLDEPGRLDEKEG